MLYTMCIRERWIGPCGECLNNIASADWARSYRGEKTIMQESSEDDLISAWHELAEKFDNRAPIDLVYACDLLNDVLRLFAPTLQGPQDPNDLSSVVATTRKIERSWNLRLTNALIDAGNAFEKGDRVTALAILDRFTEQCPWVPFVNVAKDQRSNFEAVC